MSILTVPPDWNLDRLNAFIAQQENFLHGPLKSISLGKSIDGPVTILDIDDATSDKPPVNTVVTVGRPPPNAQIVGQAEIYIGNRPVIAIAYR
jgi:hypothetical protein